MMGKKASGWSAWNSKRGRGGGGGVGSVNPSDITRGMVGLGGAIKDYSMSKSRVVNGYNVSISRGTMTIEGAKGSVKIPVGSMGTSSGMIDRSSMQLFKFAERGNYSVTSVDGGLKFTYAGGGRVRDSFTLKYIGPTVVNS